MIDNNKGVHFDQKISLNSLTSKDLKAIKLGRKLKIKYFALSFANSLKDVKYFRNLIGNKSFLISKIETKSGYENINKITKNSNAILIDRGDLSRYYGRNYSNYAEINFKKLPEVLEKIVTLLQIF